MGDVKSEATVDMTKRLQGVLGMLSSQFVLGLAAATVADYDPDTKTGNKTVHDIILGLHILLAVGILVIAIQLLVRAKKSVPKQFAVSVVGLIAVLASIGFGIARMAVDSEWYTFGMGTGFVVAISVYGAMLGNIQLHRIPEEQDS